MKYFNISTGLRGCYMPDNSYIVAVNTRRELKRVLESEAYYIRDAGFIGANKKAIAWLANICWKNRNKATLDYVVPYRNKEQDYYPYGIFCSHATRGDYLDYQKECGE